MARPRTTLTVLRTEWLTPHLVRVHFGGPGFAAFQPSEFTDSYVKFIFPRDGIEVLRTYTVRSVDVEAGMLVADFVFHGSEGIAGPWAASVQPGETIDAYGPGGAYSPRADADWHLLAGDEAALPAIAAALEAMPDDAVGYAFVEVSGPDDELKLDKPAGVELTWLHRGARPAGELLAETVRATPWRDGRVQVFIHGEAQAVMHDLRRYIRRERQVPAEWAASISGYWRRGRTEEGFREWKADLAAKETVG
ncbi:NADPH-dependent ferric siderophore reductase, contains FAD-binding and SIP domains [Nocardia amikacinitolerans]|uniref:siderophore-interacting protein n=1 Tax=Nocardia amikacinitolerans TaxID=756689 RepID=UPI000833129F|nr:siderophore-interacting protein [Nocardia amikacinitolerans]MCP2315317.1 NADPH-dependent ferric siderophore reductase, contains FAD-binding and SIP domains [Nocardia amikacinitolerans]